MDVSSRSPGGGIVVVANRLPVRWDTQDETWRTSPGGLVSALAPVLTERKGTWVGWPGTPDQDLEPFDVDGIRQVPVRLSSAEFEDYYEGFCNGTVWPLYHDAIRPVEIHRHWWRPFRDVNRRFAEAAADAASESDVIWVQDYQLQLVPGMLREALGENRIGFFLHIPFPPVEIFGRLPWRESVARGILGADVIGFHTRQSVLNFARAARRYGGATGPADALSVNGRTVKLDAYPISIDPQEFEELARSREVVTGAYELRRQLGKPDAVILGVDRLDYTKGIDLRLRAFETMLEARPDLHGKVVLVQIAVPSREGVEEYQVIKQRIEQLVGRINGAYGRPEWVPVHYQHRSLPRPELVTYYKAADVMLVTPLRDGMNLIAKEYVATRTDGTGALVLSEFAGAAEQLTAAFVVNPYDADGLARVLEQAVELGPGEQRRRMEALRKIVKRWDVYTWASQCLQDLDR